jgi:hypothetical protein
MSSRRACGHGGHGSECACRVAAAAPWLEVCATVRACGPTLSAELSSLEDVLMRYEFERMSPIASSTCIKEAMLVFRSTQESHNPEKVESNYFQDCVLIGTSTTRNLATQRC